MTLADVPTSLVSGPAYPLIMMASIIAAWWISRCQQQQLPLAKRDRLGIAIGAFCGSMILAKAPYLIADWEGMLTGSAWLSDGKTILFGMVGGYIGVEIAKGILGVKTKTGDTFAVPVAVGIGIGRIGCFQVGCCYGVPTELPWGVVFHDGVPRHPTQIYEAVFHFAAAIALFNLRKRQLLPGQLIKLYFLVYFAYRFLTEMIRPETRYWQGLTLYQWAALSFSALFVVLWIVDARNRKCESS